MFIKIKDITKEILQNNMVETIYYIDNTIIDIKKEVLNDLTNMYDNIKEDLDEDDEDDVALLEKLALAIEEIKNDEADAYDTYWDFCSYRSDDPIEELYEKAKLQGEYLDKIDSLAKEYFQIIKNSFCEFNEEVELDFSRKSPSIYITLPLKATQENVDYIYENLEYNSFIYNVTNVYEENEEYDEDENIELRLSDHDFGSYYNEYHGDISYEKNCINIYRAL